MAEREQQGPPMLMRNLTSGSPDDIIEKRMRCEQLGADEFEYHASMRLGRKDRKRFFELFCSEVLHGFQKKTDNVFQFVPALNRRFRETRQFPFTQLVHSRCSQKSRCAAVKMNPTDV